MIHEILPNLYRIEVPLPGSPLKFLNSYYLHGAKADLLIDTGFHSMPQCRETIAAALRALGSDPERLMTLATHMHGDHAGNAGCFSAPGQKLFMSAADLECLRSFYSGRMSCELYHRFLQEGFPDSELQALGNTPYPNPSGRTVDPRFRALDDGDEIDLGGFCLKTVSVPGHTPGNCMFWMEQQGVMFTGDHILFDIAPNIVCWPGLKDALGTYLKSLRLAQAYPVRLALPGHRGSGDYRDRIRELLSHHETRLVEAAQIIAVYPDCSAYEITSHLTWHIDADNWKLFPLRQKWFAVGECLSHLDHLRKRGVLIRSRDGGILRYKINRDIDSWK